MVRISALAAVTFALATLAPARAPAAPRADAAENERAVEEARVDFAEGAAHFQARRWAEALASLEKSYAAVESPNTLLLMARCVRELGRRVEAVALFERAAEDASRRVAAGESKYAPTAQAAIAEGKQVRSTLGELSVHVRREATRATLTVDGQPVTLDADGRATLLHEPGTATVVLRDDTGSEQRQSVTVLAGATLAMEFGGEAPRAAEAPGRAPSADARVAPPKPGAPSRPSWIVPAAVASGGLTLVGLGLFAGFGLSAQATYDDLAARCGPDRCGPSDRADADRGERAQTIANVSLGVAATFAVVTVVLLLVGSSPGGPRISSTRGGAEARGRL